MALGGLFAGTLQPLLYPRVQRKLGTVRTFQLALPCFLFLVPIMPALAAAQRAEQGWLVFMLLLMFVLLQACACACYAYVAAS